MRLSNQFLLIAFMLIAVAAVSFSILHYDLAAKLQNLNAIVSTLALIPAALGGYGYARLNVFDNLSDIDDALRKTLRHKVRQLRRHFLGVLAAFMFSFIILTMAFALKDTFDAAHYFLAIFMAFLLVIATGITFWIVPALLAVESLREKLEDEKLKTKKRFELIARLQKARETNPLVTDDRLEAHNRLFNPKASQGQGKKKPGPSQGLH